MNPLPEHVRQANVLSDVVKALLDHQRKEYDTFTPITIDLPKISGIEPDYCFYIENWEAVSGKNRIDWEVDPPPDLVLEVDITSYTTVEDYLPYCVPEVWLFKKNRLAIYQLVGNQYTEQAHSQVFLKLDLPGTVDDCLTIALKRNTSAAVRHLRHQLEQQ